MTETNEGLEAVPSARFRRVLAVAAILFFVMAVGIKLDAPLTFWDSALMEWASAPSGVPAFCLHLTLLSCFAQDPGVTWLAPSCPSALD